MGSQKEGSGTLNKMKIETNTSRLGLKPADEWEDEYQFKSYLVDPASSRMLVSKIKPCM